MDLTKYINCKAHKQWLFFTNEDKPLRPCCYFKTDFDPINLDDYRNQLSNVDIEKNCHNCIKQEQEGNKYSQRYMLETELLDNQYWITVAFDNLCDMKCIYCNAQYSSQIYSESIKFNSNVKQIKILESMSINLLKKIDLMKEFFLTTNFDKVNFTILGGEPLLNPKVYEFLDWLIEKGFSKKINLGIFSNGKTYHDKIWKYCEHFQFITLTFSIDGTDDTFEYIRFGGKYSVVKHNIDTYYSKISEFKNFTITLSYAMTWMNSINFAEWFNIFSKDYPKIGYIHMNKLVYPEEYSVDVIPLKARAHILEQIENQINKMYANSTFMEAYEIYKTYLITGPDNSRLFEKALINLKTIDFRRDIDHNHSFKKILSIFKSYI
jgi:sulfatase maturation enzyme AslB (radical SAM superfamily)